eukprot:Transcript_5041.p1 GENE.Transcript_5041~~Transcript_5041.p1  ORF type:complete len:411 (-),score=174.05 Transcript_5041:334-1491(-)
MLRTLLVIGHLGFIAGLRGGVLVPDRVLEARAQTHRFRSRPVVASGNAARSKLRSRLVGVGSCAPPTRVTNVDLEELVDTTDEWIAQRTGIRSRHLLAPGETMSELGSKAASNALEMAGVDPEEVELVIFATSSADDLFGDAAHVARLVGATNAVAFDLTAACSGFLFGMNTASQFLHNGAYKTALVIGGDALSRWVDWDDRSTCVLFGDGAGAVVMKAAESDEESGVLGYEMHSNGAGRPDLNLVYSGKERDLGGVATVTMGTYDTISMTGKEVYKFATTKVPKVLQEAFANANVEADDIDWLVMHQANIRIMETISKKLGIPMDKVIRNVDEYGNTSAGSIPLALDEAVRSGKIKKGDTLAVTGFGAGLSWGACVIRWGGESQ